MGKDAGIVRSLAGIFKRSRKESGLNSPALSVEARSDQIATLTRQLEAEKRRNTQLILLNELSQQLETLLDEPVAAQLAMNTLEHGIECSYVCFYLHDPERSEFAALASAGKHASLIPPGYRQEAAKGVIGRAARLRKTQIVGDTRLDPDFFAFQNEESLSTLVVPVIHNGSLKGVLEINAQKAEAFDGADVVLVESVAEKLIRAWERSGYHQHLTELIQAGISLSTLIEPPMAVREIAAMARRALQARFVYVTLIDHSGNFTQQSFSGHAPKLLRQMENAPLQNSLTQTALHASQAFRIRDIRKYPLKEKIEIDHGGLRSVLVIPIRLHRLSIGAVLAFGKESEIFFTENDESLGSLLASQSAAAVESTWLYQELRNTLSTTTQLYQVSFQILQTEELHQAVNVILETACKVASASMAGVVLFTPDNKVEFEAGVDANGAFDSARHPLNLIEQAMSSGASIFVSDQATTQVCFPIQTHLRKYGGLWLKVSEGINYDARHTAALQTLANQLERAVLLYESRQQAREIEAAYEELEVTYDRTLAALMSALDARDRETEGHSLRVSQLAFGLGKAMGLDDRQLKALERGSLLHDIGKIGISDVILHKPGALSEMEWTAMRQHPDIGARIVADIPFLQDTVSVIRHHQERWDGSGYPAGLRGSQIPLLARIFAAADAYDALTSDRPYRKKVSSQEALGYLRDESGSLFDPQVVSALEKMIAEGQIPELIAPDRAVE